MNDQQTSGSRRLLEQTRKAVQLTRNVFWQASLVGEVDDDLHLEIAARVLQYHDILYEFRDLPALDEDDFPDISEVRDCVGERVGVVEESPGLGRPNQLVEKPAVLDVPTDRLVDYTEQLDDLAQKLGFGAEPNTDGVTDIIEDEHVRSAFTDVELDDE